MKSLDHAYNEYLASPDKKFKLDGKRYYKIIDLDSFCDLSVVTLPVDFLSDEPRAFSGKGFECAEDEYGHIFKLTRPAHYTVRDKESLELHLKIRSFGVINHDSAVEIGEYLRRL